MESHAIPHVGVFDAWQYRWIGDSVRNIPPPPPPPPMTVDKGRCQEVDECSPR